VPNRRTWFQQIFECEFQTIFQCLYLRVLCTESINVTSVEFIISLKLGLVSSLVFCPLIIVMTSSIISFPCPDDPFVIPFITKFGSIWSPKPRLPLCTSALKHIPEKMEVLFESLQSQPENKKSVQLIDVTQFLSSTLSSSVPSILGLFLTHPPYTTIDSTDCQ
jgi:hypothetical protein